MSFREKYESCMGRLNSVGKPDYPEDEISYHADFIELWTAFTDSEEVSYGDIQDRFYGEPDENNSAEVNDSNEIFIRRIIGLLEERAVLFGEAYPFGVDISRGISLKKNLTVRQSLYILLLCSSSLDVFNALNAELTSDFEALSFHALKNFLPNAVVRAFGKHSEYRGNAPEKILQLAMEMGISLDGKEFAQINPRNVQERGLDVVGWIPFPDHCPNKVVFLCQCACGKDYALKQHDTQRFANYLNFYKTRPQHTLFIPYSLIRMQDGQFFHSDDIQKGFLVFERLRMLALLPQESGILESLQSVGMLQELGKRPDVAYVSFD